MAANIEVKASAILTKAAFRSFRTWHPRTSRDLLIAWFPRTGRRTERQFGRPRLHRVRPDGRGRVIGAPHAQDGRCGDGLIHPPGPSPVKGGLWPTPKPQHPPAPGPISDNVRSRLQASEPGAPGSEDRGRRAAGSMPRSPPCRPQSRNSPGVIFSRPRGELVHRLLGPDLRERRRARLLVTVDQQHVPAALCQGCGDIHGRRVFSPRRDYAIGLRVRLLPQCPRRHLFAWAAPIAPSLHPASRRYLATRARSFRVIGSPVSIAFISARFAARSSSQSSRSGLSRSSRNACAAMVCVSSMPGTYCGTVEARGQHIVGAVNRWFYSSALDATTPSAEFIRFVTERYRSSVYRYRGERAGLRRTHEYAQCAPAAAPGLDLRANRSAIAAIARTIPMMAKVSLKPMMRAWRLTILPIATIA
jgi:hypothetical protein